MKTLLLVLGIGTLCACGPQFVVTDGAYQRVDTRGVSTTASLTVSLAERTATVAVTGENLPTVFQMTRLDGLQWEIGCNLEAGYVETWTLSPDPAALGALSLAGPRLLAGCYHDEPDPDQVVLDGTGVSDRTHWRLVFQRLGTQ